MKKVFLLILIFSSPCFASNKLIQKKTQGYAVGTGNNTINLTSNVTQHSLLVCFISAENNSGGGGTVTVADNVNVSSWTQAGGYLRSNTVRFMAIFYTTNTAAGSMTVTVAKSVSQYMTIGVLEYQVDTPLSVVLDNVTSNNIAVTGTVVQTDTVTVTGANDLVVAGYTQGNATLSNTTVDLPFLMLQDQVNGGSAEGGGSADYVNTHSNQQATFRVSAIVSFPIAMAASFITPTVGPIFVSSVAANTTGGATQNITSPSFTDTNTNDLIIISCHNDFNDGAGSFNLATTNSGLTIALATNTLTTQFGGTGFWYACTGAGGFTSKTFTCNSNNNGSPSIFVESWSGTACTNASPSLGIGNKAIQSKSTGQPTLSKTTSANNSWVIGNGVDAGGARAVTAGTNQFLAYLNNDATDSKTNWVVHQTSVTATSATSVTMNVAGVTGGDDWDMAWLEILAGTDAPAVSTSGSSIRNTILDNSSIR